MLGPLEVDLGDAVVFEHGDALLAGVDGDEQLALRLRQGRALRWCVRRGALRARWELRALGGLPSSGRGGAAGATSALGDGGAPIAPAGFLRPRPPRVPRRRFFRAAGWPSVARNFGRNCDGGYFRCGCWSGGRLRRLLHLLLLAAE